MSLKPSSDQCGGAPSFASAICKTSGTSTVPAMRWRSSAEVATDVGERRANWTATACGGPSRCTLKVT